MQLRSILIYSVATATVALASPLSLPITDLSSSAYAATNVSVSFNTFYDDLGQYGDWVNYSDSYVFVPRNLPARWRPYTVGHWVYTKHYGWLWVSEEPFGWATYHYGRWGYAEDIGWYWIPGTRWAPAWVSWRRSKDHMVWAPLPPGRGNDVSVEVSIQDIPDEYWVAVPSDRFLDDDLSVVVVVDDSERVRVVDAAEPVGNVVVVNNVVVNNVIDVDYVQKVTHKEVKTVTVKETDDPQQAGKGSGDQVTIFNQEVKEDRDAKPKQVKDVEAVKQEQAQKKEGEQQGTETQPSQGEQPAQTEQPKGTEQPAQPEQGQEQKTKPKTGEKPTQPEGQPMEKKGKAIEEPTQPEGVQPEQGQEQPTKKKKGKATEESTQPESTQPEQGQEQPVKKKKGKATEKSTQPESTQPEQGQEQPTTKKKKPAQSEEMQPEQGQGGEEPAQGKKQKKQPPAAGCDPATGEGCAQ